MRRVAALVRPEARERAHALLERIEGVEGRVVTSLEDVDLSETDCLWLHDVRAASPALRTWLEGGGRLLATLDAVLVAVELGLETVPPDELRHSVWDGVPGQGAPFGLAAFGAHPLFEGLQQGTSTWAPVVGEPYRWAVHLATRPQAGVVAVERRGPELNPGRIVAWEYDVGHGGLLCIGAGICPEASDRRWEPQLRALLGNALAGFGIPHRERPPGARHWPLPGQKVLRRDLAPVPELPCQEAEWTASASSLALEIPPDADRPWVLAGRRGFLAGSDDHGLREAWLHPFRVAHGASVSVAGSVPASTRIRVAPDQLDRRAEAAGDPVVERCTMALEHPILHWEVDPGEGRPVLLEWTTDLRRSWPYPPACGGDLELTVAPDGRRAALRAAGDPFRVVVDIEGGTLEAAPTDGPAVRMSVRAVGRCRVRVVGASDEADLDRTRQMLARRGFAGLRAQRADHARELATYATSIDVPDPGVVEAFEWAKARLDGLLAGTPGVGRCLTAGYAASGAGTGGPGAAWYAGADACRMALAQLAAGDRGGPRDTLKFLSLTQDVDGGVLEECSTSGLARFGGGAVAPLYLLLAARYAAWTGELDFLARRWAAVRRALEHGLAVRPWERAPEDAASWASALDALQPLAEALGHPETAEALIAHAAAARSTIPPGAEATSGDLFADGQVDDALARWQALARQVRMGGRSGPDDARASAAFAAAAVEGLWGVRANALEGAVQLAPWFPPAWDRMALDRLRVGRTVLSARLRRRFGQVAARIERVHGPRLHVDFSLRGAPASGSVMLDDVELRGGRAAFEADGNHALVWHD